MPTMLSQLKDATCTIADQVSRKKNGNYIIRRGYFYTHGYDSDKFRKAVEAVLKRQGINATVVDHGDHWAAFKGSASLANSSHWYVEVKVA